MTREQKEVHERLLAKLPSRIHSVDPDYGPGKYIGMGYERGKNPKQGRPVIVCGVKYKSLRAAGKATGVTRQAIHQWLMKGDKRAQYADIESK